MAKSSTPWWTDARNDPKARNSRRDRRTPLVRANSARHRGTLEGVAVHRLSMWPKGSVGSPESWALDPGIEVEWEADCSVHLPLGVRWKRLSESSTLFQFELPLEARCLGLGERYGGLNLRGRVHTLVTLDDPNHTEATDAMYKCVPILLVAQGENTVGILLDSPAPQRWDLDREQSGEGAIELLSRRGWDAYVFGPAPLQDVVKAYSRLTGRLALPPRWSLGHQQCRWSYATEHRVRQVAFEFRKRKIPCDAVVLDIDYLDDYRVFTISRDRFPHFERMASELEELGFKLITIVDPGVKRDTSDPVYVDGRKKGAFCRRPDGRLFVGSVWAGPSCFPDFGRSEVREWWQEKLHFLLSRGVAGIWNDMNEPALFGHQSPLPAGATALPNESEQAFLQQTDEGPVGHLEVRSLYGQGMAVASWQAQEQNAPNRRPFVLTRSCYAGMQRYGAVWLGDNKSWFEHLRMSIPMLLNMGLSGIPFCGVDIGGFGGDCDAELLMRWYQVGIFYPFFRNHCASGQRFQEPWAFGAATESSIRRLIETRYRLLPYLEQLFVEHQKTGAPLMRPLQWHEPRDDVGREIDDQFFLGRELLVAPILSRGHRRRAVYLPKGQWYPFEGGPALRGAQYHDVVWAFDQVPAFVRDGAIIPMAGVIQNTGELPQADITFRCFGVRARGSFREDDGASLDYQQGAYNEWMLELHQGRLEVKLVHRGLSAPKRRFFAEIDGRRRRVRLP